jgi:REP element-mobilizing transposase RayT
MLLARYVELYGVDLFAFIIMGNHMHMIVRCPRGNRAAFMQAFNGMVSRLVKENVDSLHDNHLWGRRYSAEALVSESDVWNWLMYIATNPISSGLVSRVHDYSNFNFYWDLIEGRQRKFNFFRKNDFQEAKRRGLNPKQEDYIDVHTLQFKMLPFLSTMERATQRQFMLSALAIRSREEVKKRKESGKGFMGQVKLSRIIPGTIPRSSKNSTRHSHRPLILTLCLATRTKYLTYYFEMCSCFSRASERLRSGDLSAPFPPGMYRPRTSTGIVSYYAV